MDIKKCFEAMENDTKVFFTNNFGNKELSIITGIAKDDFGSYRVYDENDNDASIDMIEPFDENNYRNITITFKVYENNDIYDNIYDMIADKLFDENIYFTDLTVKE